MKQISTPEYRFAYSKSCFASNNVMPCTKETFDKMMNSAQVKRVCSLLETAIDHPSDPAISKFLRGTKVWCKKQQEDIALALQNPTYENVKRALKSALPVFYPHTRSFKNNQRSSDNATPSGLVMLDVDAKNLHDEHLEITPQQLWERVKDRAESEGIALAYITPSGQGLRLVADLRPGEAIVTAQQRLARALGITHFDTSTKDYARCSFFVVSEYILYRNEPRLSVGVGSVGALAPAISEAQPVSEVPATTTATTPAAPAEKETFHGMRFEAIVADILHAYEQQSGTVLEEGNRHPAYTYVAGFVRELVDNDAERLFRVMGDFKGLGESERRQLCEWWSQQDAKGTGNEILQHAIAAARRELGPVKMDTDMSHLSMPKQMPRLFQTITRPYPDYFRLPGIFACAPAMGALPNVRVQLTDTEQCALTSFSLLIGEAAQGKSTFDYAIEYMTKHVREASNAEIRKEQAYRTEKEKCKNKEEQPEEYRSRAFFIPSSITKVRFINRQFRQPGVPMYLHCNELDASNMGGKAAYNLSSGDERLIAEHKCLDHESETSAGLSCQPYLSIYMQATPDAMKRKFKNNTDGTSQRWMLIDLPTDWGITRHIQDYTEEEKNYLTATGDWLHSWQNEELLDYPWLRDEMDAFLAQKTTLSQQIGDPSIQQLANRAKWFGTKMGALVALLYAYDEHGGQPDLTISDEHKRIAAQWARVTAEYQWRSQMTYFGPKSQYANTSTEPTKKAKILAALPADFTREQLYAECENNGVLKSTTKRGYINEYKKEGVIRADDNDPNLFHKVA